MIDWKGVSPTTTIQIKNDDALYLEATQRTALTFQNMVFKGFKGRL